MDNYGEIVDNLGAYMIKMDYLTVSSKNRDLLERIFVYSFDDLTALSDAGTFRFGIKMRQTHGTFVVQYSGKTLDAMRISRINWQESYCWRFTNLLKQAKITRFDSCYEIDYGTRRKAQEKLLALHARYESLGSNAIYGKGVETVYCDGLGNRSLPVYRRAYLASETHDNVGMGVVRYEGEFKGGMAKVAYQEYLFNPVAHKERLHKMFGNVGYQCLGQGVSCSPHKIGAGKDEQFIKRHSKLIRRVVERYGAQGLVAVARGEIW